MHLQHRAQGLTCTPSGLGGGADTRPEKPDCSQQERAYAARPAAGMCRDTYR